MQKLVKWVFFGVIVSLAPLLADLANEVTQSGGNKVLDSIVGVLAHGELLLISAAIAADAVGDLIASGPAFKTLKYMAGGACVSIILFGSIWYADIAANFHNGHATNGGIIAKWTMMVLGFTVLSSGCGKFVAED